MNMRKHALGAAVSAAAIAMVAMPSWAATPVFQTQDDDTATYTFGSSVESGETAKSNIGSTSGANNNRFAFRSGIVNVKEGGYVRVSGYDSSYKTYGNWCGCNGNSATLNVMGGTFWVDKGSYNLSTYPGVGRLRIGVNGASNGRTGVARVNVSAGLFRVDNILMCGASTYNADTSQNAPVEMTISGGTAVVENFWLGARTGTISSTAEFNLTGGELQVNSFVFQPYHNQTFNWGSGKIVAGKADVFTSENLTGNATRTVNVTGAPAVFDTGNFAQTIPADIAGGTGTLKLTGGNTVTLTASPSFGLWIEGTTLAFASGNCGNITIPSLTLGSGASIVLDADSIPSGTSASITATGGISLPDGGDVLDFVTLTGSSTADCEKSLSADGKTITVSKAGDPDYTWNGNGTNWGDSGAWQNAGSAATWANGNNAIFSTANASATVAADVAANTVVFNAAATVDGSSTLTVPTVSVASDVYAVISAPTAGVLEKTGGGTLTLGSSRTDATTLTEGTLKMLNGATVSGLTLGTSDPTKPVVFDYGGQTLVAAPETYLVTGSAVTLTNGTFAANGMLSIRDATKLPSVLTIAKGTELYKYGTDQLVFDAQGETTVNVVGGTIRQTGQHRVYIQHVSTNGTLRINVTDGGLLHFPLTVLAFCSSGNFAYYNPSLYMVFNDSTFRVRSTYSDLDICFGCPDSGTTETHWPIKPTGVIAATNSVFDVGRAIYIGRNITSAETAGSYTADFENCVITAKTFAVNHDRPLNNARFNGTRFVFGAANGSIYANDGADNWFTVGTDGLTIDTQAYSATLNANLGGPGVVTKVGSGTLVIQTNQTASAALNIGEGTAVIRGDFSLVRPVAVAAGATLSLMNAQTSIATLTLADGSTLDIASYELGTVPMAVTTLNLPASGTVNLTLGGGAFRKGIYEIYARQGVTAADGEKFLPSTGDETFAWSVDGNTLVLTVGSFAGNTWTGGANDGRMSTGGNWLDGSAPVDGEDVDFSSVPAELTIIADIANATFGTVTMGEGVITFTNAIAATNFTDTSKISVGADSTVTVVGDLEISGDTNRSIVYTISAGGRFVVMGDIIATEDFSGGNLYPSATMACPGTFVARGLVNRGTVGRNFRLYNNGSGSHVTWVIGDHGISSSGSPGATGAAGFWCFNYGNSSATIIADADFTIAAWLTNREKLVLNTTGPDGTPHTITVGDGTTGLLDHDGYVETTGAGKVLFNCVSTFSGGLAVKGSSTVAVNPGCRPGDAHVHLYDGSTLEVAQAGTVELPGWLTFEAGTTLKVASSGSAVGAITAAGGAVSVNGEGTVALVVAGEPLATGEYSVLTSSAPLADNVVARFALDATAVKGANDAWIAGSNVLSLNIGDRSQLPAGVWVGGTDGNFSTAANWKNGVVPSAGTALDFSSVASARTINVDVPNAVFGAVTMGAGVITFTGSITATGFSDGFKVAVGENSTVTVAGDYVFSASVDEYICNTVAAGGRFVVTGDIVMDTGKDKYLRPCAGSIAGTIAAKGLVNRQSKTVNNGMSFALAPQSIHVNWEVGEDGISGSRMLFVSANADSFAKITASADFTVSATTPIFQRLELDTAGHVITLGNGTAGGLMGNGTNTISGTGRVVANYDIDDLTTTAKYKVQPFVVKNSATFAVMPGADIGSGAVTVESGATLEVAASGTATHRGDLSLADGACLGFNFTEKKVAPVLDIASGKTMTVEGAVKVKISSAAIRPKGGKYVLTTCGGFDAEGVTVQLAADAPQWVKSLSVNDDGNLVLDVKSKGFTLIVK